MGYIVSLIIGEIIGMLLTCLCIAAKRGDRMMGIDE